MDMTPAELSLFPEFAPKPPEPEPAPEHSLVPAGEPADIPAPAYVTDGPGWVETRCDAGHPVGKRPPGSKVGIAACDRCRELGIGVAEAAPEPEKAKRKRRTKAEIEAARAAEAPPSPAEPESQGLPLLPTPQVTVQGVTTEELADIAEHIANAPLTVVVELGPKTLAELARLLAR